MHARKVSVVFVGFPSRVNTVLELVLLRSMTRSGTQYLRYKPGQESTGLIRVMADRSKVDDTQIPELPVFATLTVGLSTSLLEPPFRIAQRNLFSELLGALDAISEYEFGGNSARAFSQTTVAAHSTMRVPNTTTVINIAHLRRQQRQPNILVVDDSRAICSQVSAAMESMGITAECATNSSEAMRKFSMREFDAVILDVELPGKNGYELCRELRQFPGRRSVPVLMLTSHSGTFDRLRGVMAGCAGYMAKPVDLKRFRLELERVLPDYPGLANYDARLHLATSA